MKGKAFITFEPTKKPRKRSKKHDLHHSLLLEKAAKEAKNALVELKEKDTNVAPGTQFVSSGMVSVGEHKPAEQVHHPAHYGGVHNAYEVIKVIDAWELNFNLGNTVKYIGRAGKKGCKLTDLEKAAFYLNREIEKLKQS
jgi:hypothetical protein